ncbi:MAG: type II secretion system F family protein [Pirellulales bacterium]|nr:type II secretion system F family protein [Pirellulales bacterium]
MDPTFIIIAVFMGVTAMVGALAVMLRSPADAKAEDRLAVLTGAKKSKSADPMGAANLLSESLDATPNYFEEFFNRFLNLNRLLLQANANLTIGRLLAICGGLGAIGTVIAPAMGFHPGLAPVLAIAAASLPFIWLVFRRKMRFKKFATQLPDALDLIARALRSGHSLAAAFDLVGQEVADPLGTEFLRVFEEQNLGIPLDEAMNDLTDRVPNLDLKFFTTAIILQRQTGGDLAEILDKLSNLIRERFKIWGQVQALTGEGRLSGVILLALPPLLFLAIYYLNPDYVMVLFEDELGKKMLLGAIGMQVLGALVIRKIVNIKV